MSSVLKISKLNESKVGSPLNIKPDLLATGFRTAKEKKKVFKFYFWGDVICLFIGAGAFVKKGHYDKLRRITQPSVVIQKFIGNRPINYIYYHIYNKKGNNGMLRHSLDTLEGE